MNEVKKKDSLAAFYEAGVIKGPNWTEILSPALTEVLKPPLMRMVLS